MKKIIDSVKGFARAWDNFWFGLKDFSSLGLFRVVFGTLLFIMYAFRQKDVEFYFFQSGFVSWDTAQEILSQFYARPFIWFPGNDLAALVMHSTYLVGIFIMVLGVFGRWFQCIILFLHLTFVFRNPPIMYGADLIASFFLFYLCLADSTRHYSVLNLFIKPTQKVRPVSDALNSLAIRMFQIQLCVIYAYTGMEKLKGGPWWDGTALWGAVTNSQLAFVDFTFLAHFPIVIIVGTYFTLLFEVYFTALVWVPKIRPLVLFCGVVFHALIGLTMGLVFFSGIMVSAYVFFSRHGLRFRNAADRHSKANFF